MVTSSCGPKTSSTTTKTGTGGGDSLALTQTGDAPPGLDLRLSNGKQGPAAADRSKLVPATKIPDGDAESILNRLKPLQQQPDDQKDFALRKRSQPPPRTGKTISARPQPQPD
jgi:hypothetical protein